MLNEDKVKLMTRMAMYESKEGAEDFKISSYYRKDYSSFHTIVTIIWVTIGYMIAVGVGAVAFMDVILENLNFAFIDFIHNYYDFGNRDELKLKNKVLFSIDNEKDFCKAIIYYISGMTDNFAIEIYNEIIHF